MLTVVVSIFFSLLVSGPAAMAKSAPLCKSAEACLEVIRKAQDQLAQTEPGYRISSTGALFLRNTTYPSLGEAYQDPSGVIWGSVVRREGSALEFGYYEAEEYCRQGGTRLPTAQEYQSLARYLGLYTANGYSPYVANQQNKPDYEKQYLLFGLVNWFWVALNPDEGIFRGFNGQSGDLYRETFHISKRAVRCVMNSN